MSIMGIILTVIAIGVGIFIYRLVKIPNMTFDEMISYTTRNNENATITVGIIQNGEASFVLYGEDGTILPQAEHIYEIGSITKLFTVSLLYKAIDEGLIDLDDTIDKYLELPKKEYYPTIRRLITHTSGYKRHYLNKQIVSNFFADRNLYYSVSTEMMIERIGKVDLNDRDYEHVYSNFGISVVGAVLSKVYERDFETLINEFIEEELNLKQTKISDSLGDLENYWSWAKSDAYMPAGALISTINDMLKFAQMQMQDQPGYLSGTHEILAKINAGSPLYTSINMDSIGAAWMIDSANNSIWHDGGTGDYNCYFGFDKDKQIAVIVLSNLKWNYRINATVMGARLLTDLQSNEIDFGQDE